MHNWFVSIQYQIDHSMQTIKIIVLTFYSAPHNNVWYTTDSGVTEIAKMSFNIAGYSRDREIEVVFEFDVTLTEIHVCVRDRQSKKCNKIVFNFLSRTLLHRESSLYRVPQHSSKIRKVIIMVFN